jgi:hypothetical protein
MALGPQCVCVCLSMRMDLLYLKWSVLLLHKVQSSISIHAAMASCLPNLLKGLMAIGPQCPHFLN